METLNSNGVKNLREPAQSQKIPSAEAIRTWLVEQLADLLYVAPEEIDVREPFDSYGLASREAVMLSGDLEEFLDRRLSPTVVYEYPNIKALADYLAQESAEAEEPSEEVEGRPLANEPIAVIGLGCRFPGAESPRAFWRLLREGVDGITEVPPDRWDVDAFFDPNPGAPGKTYTRWGGFVEGVDRFDPQFFGISPREADRMDPQQRLLLEVTWEALEDAGYAPLSLAGSEMGVFLGISNNDYSLLQYGDIESIEAYTGTGNAFSVAANRLSYFLDLKGPSFAIDTACSSSLVSVHLACQALRRGEARLALAGGVNLILSPELHITFSQARMMSRSGRCKTFDASADGYVRGEGCGMILLKPLSDALQAGDQILAVIQGSAINHDGRSNGLTAPNGLAQQAVIRKALKDASVAPAEIGYVETHGTGTILGDPIEAEALGAVMRDRPQDRPCTIGSVKTNIGHLEAAAGIAGLIKVVLMMQHGEIPPHLHFSEINPYIPLDQMPLVIPTDPRPWPSGNGSRHAGVSSFGFGGTNAHVVLGEAPVREPVRNDPERPLHILTLSARGEAALRELAARFERHLGEEPPGPLADLCYTANTGRSHFSHRLAVVAETREQMREKLAAAAAAVAEPGRRLAFLFTGQGAQYPDMGRELYETQPAFRATLDQCAEILDVYLEKPLLSVIFADSEDESLLNETTYTQPALFALEYALAQLWRSWGIEPNFVLGHSVGEYVAACVAGVFGLEDGLKLIAARGRLMGSLPRDGEMAVVFAGSGRVKAALKDTGGSVDLAAANGPSNTVISGRREAVQKVVAQLKAEGLTVRPLAVSHAFHSPLMTPILDEFEAVAQEITYHEPQIPFASNLTGRLLAPGEAPEAVYWRRHIRQGVQFQAGIESLAAASADVFLEVGPHPSLLSMGRRCLPEHEALWLPSLRRKQPDWSVLLESLGELFTAGFEIDWDGFNQDYARSRVQLPTYPFQRERCWFEPATATQRFAVPRRIAGEKRHPLLGRKLSSPLQVTQYESTVSTRSLPYLEDHRVRGTAVLPAAACLEMALAAISEAVGGGQPALADVDFGRPLLLDQDRTVQAVLSPPASTERSFELYALDADAEPGKAGWRRLSACKVSDEASGETAALSLEEIQTRCANEISVQEVYQTLQAQGVGCGPRFQGIERFWQREGEALALTRRLSDWAPERGAYQLNPALLDVCFQTLAVKAANGDASARDRTYLPARLGRLRVYDDSFGERLWSHALLDGDDGSAADGFAGDVRLLDEDGRLLVEFLDLRFEPLGEETQCLFQPRSDRSLVRVDEGAEREDAPVQERLTPEELLAAEPAQRQTLLASHLRDQIAQVLKLAPDRIDLERPINFLGLDSIMAIELKNRVERGLGVNLPVASLLQGPNLVQLADRVLGLLSAPAVSLGADLTTDREAAGEYGLSYGQRAMWFQHQMAPGSVFNPVYAVRIRSAVDVPAMQEIFQKLVDRHPALRTTFFSRRGEPVQRVHERAEAFFQHEDASGWSQKRLNERLAQEASRTFDLEHGPLFKIFVFSRSDTEHVLMLTAHHIVVDLWSLVVLINEFSMLYGSPEKPVELPPLELFYTDYIRWQTEMLEGPPGRDLWDYWREKLGGELPVLNLPTDRPRPPVQTHPGAIQSLRLDSELTRGLEALGESQGVTLFMTLLAAFKVLLYRYSGQQDIIVGTPTTGRSRAELADLVGYLVNPVALRTQLSPTLTFADFLGRVRETVVEAIDHQDYPFGLLVEKLQPVRDPSRLPISQVMFILQRAQLLNDQGVSKFAVGMEGLQMDLAGLRLESVTVEQQMAPFDLTLMMAEADGELVASMTHNTDLYDADTVERMLSHFRSLLRGIVADPGASVSELPLLTASERRRMLVEWNDTVADFPSEQCVHQLFEAQAAQTPNAPAVVFEGRSLSYAELNRRANQLAHYLRRLGVGPETLVGISVERSLEMVVGLLGILKAGGAYLPLDPDYPTERLAFMLDDTGVTVLLTQSHVQSNLPTFQPSSNLPTIICLDTDWSIIAQEPEANLATDVAPDNLAYVIYTSGSTGRPKGVLLHHRGLCNLVQAQTRAFRVTAESRVLQFASFSFDASVSETFMALLKGARLVLAPQEKLVSMPELHRLLQQERITTVTLPPSVLNVMPAEGLPELKTLISAGEACTPEVVAKWSEGRRFFNAYGPTEATIGPTMHRVEGIPGGNSRVPIGRAIANTQVYLLDADLQPVPVGVPGEIHIGGVGVGRGYLNRSRLTAAKFIPDPFGRDPGARLYKTGDLARYRPDGNLEFLERIDHQVKVRGFRIELGEIETLLGQHPGVQKAVALAREDVPGDKRLVAYFLADGKITPTTGKLRSFLKEKLPEYMVPSAFVTLETLPLTPNGKVDRRALPAPTTERPDLATAYVRPKNQVQRTIASIWQEVIGVDRVGVHDNFFDLGGHSLLVAQVHNRLQEAFDRELSLVEMFQYPTVHTLAEYLNRQSEGASFEASLDRASRQKEAIQRQRERMKRLSQRRRAQRRDD